MEAFLSILLLETITSLSSSIFIVVCLSHVGFQRANITPFNIILISLNVSNMFFTIFMSAYVVTGSLWSYFYHTCSLFYLLSFMTMWSITSSAWLTTVLCFFYFMKILPPQPGVLMTIKNKIGAIVWRLILMAEILSIGGSLLPILASLQNQNEENSTVNNVTLEESSRHNIKFANFILILNCLPFILILGMTVASAWFLRVYDCQMKNNGTLVNTNVKDYRRAVQTMTGLLIFYLFIILTAIINTLELLVYQSVGYWISVISLLSFPTGQSTLLIYSNQNLKQILRNLITSLTCRESGE